MKRTKKYYENLNKIIKCDEERKNDLLYKYYVYKNSKSLTDDLLKQVVKKLFDIKSKQEQDKNWTELPFHEDEISLLGQSSVPLTGSQVETKKDHTQEEQLQFSQ